MNGRSIRFRLTVWYGIALACGLALFGGLVWISMRQRLAAELDEDLRGGAQRFEDYFRREAGEESGQHLITEMEEFCQGLGQSHFMVLQGDRGYRFAYPPDSRSRLRASRVIEHRFTFRDERFELVAGTTGHEMRHTLDLLGLLLLGLIPAVAAAASLGGAWLSRRALQPVDQITTAARTIGIENLSRRLPPPGTGDEIERLIEVWNTMLARLESAVGTLSQFAADASHELRTPLAVIRTSAELALRRDREPESYRDSLAEIATEAERMTAMVEDLLFLARSDARTASMPMGPVDLSEVVREVAAELRDLARLRGIDLQVVATARLDVSANRAAMRRLVLVLLDNAVKYSHPGGKVVVRIAPPAVSVEDQGVGIASEDLPRIFQRFYRADKARTHDGSSAGYGLGLSLAETIANIHGARISVATEEGRGSVFTVTWPIRDAGSVA
jgi:heavy metal sensor kinase